MSVIWLCVEEVHVHQARLFFGVAVPEKAVVILPVPAALQERLEGDGVHLPIAVAHLEEDGGNLLVGHLRHWHLEDGADALAELLQLQQSVAGRVHLLEERPDPVVGRGSRDEGEVLQQDLHKVGRVVELGDAPCASAIDLGGRALGGAVHRGAPAAVGELVKPPRPLPAPVHVYAACGIAAAALGLELGRVDEPQ